MYILWDGSTAAPVTVIDWGGGVLTTDRHTVTGTWEVPAWGGAWELMARAGTWEVPAVAGTWENP